MLKSDIQFWLRINRNIGFPLALQFGYVTDAINNRVAHTDCSSCSLAEGQKLLRTDQLSKGNIIFGENEDLAYAEIAGKGAS